MLVLELHFSRVGYPRKVSSRLDGKGIKGLMTSRHGLHVTSQFTAIGERCTSALGEAFIVLNGEGGHECMLFFS